jgi:hypothetical protein
MFASFTQPLAVIATDSIILDRKFREYKQSRTAALLSPPAKCLLVVGRQPAARQSHKGTLMRVLNVMASALAAFAAIILAGAAGAQSAVYPDRPVKVIVPFAAGGPTDVTARLIGQKLLERFGQQFYVENLAGAGGNIGMAAAAKAPPTAIRS